MMMRLTCPKCNNRMLYQPRGPVAYGKSKKCVYCGKTFKVTGNIASVQK